MGVRLRRADVRPWEIVAEIVCLTARPVPKNPFALDFEFLDSLPPSEYLFLSGALCSFLREVYLKDTPFVDLIFQDLSRLLTCHFTRIPDIFAQLPPGTIDPQMLQDTPPQ